jgi:CelD/BcsL family acetyltransferase involved in cellulose biosynthesis
VLPLYRFSVGPVRVSRLLGHGPADQLGPVCAPGDAPFAADALRQSLREGCDVFVGDVLAAEEGWAERLGGAVLRAQASPTLRLEGSWDDLLASRSRNFREQVRRRERKLAREHDLRFRLSDDAARLGEDLDTLFRLHRARWAGETGFGGADEPFHRDFAALALERGWLRLWLLELDDRAVAAWYGFRFAGVESYYQAGRDPAYERESVGFVLLAHTIRAATEDGADEYRFLRGGEGFKYRFASEDRGLETIAVARTARGSVALAATRLALRVPARAALKRLLR